MRHALLELLPAVLVLTLASPASAAPSYPACPAKIGDRNLTSTSHRGDELNPQIVCWYEERQPPYEFHAGWTTPANPEKGGYGCGRANPDASTTVISQTHDASVATNRPHQDMPGFKTAIDEFLRVLESGYAQACAEPEPEAAESLQVRIEKNKYVITKPSRKHCEGRTCQMEDNARLRICNHTKKVHKPFSRSPGNKFGPVKVKPGECYKRRVQNPSSTDEVRLTLADKLFIYTLLLEIDPFRV